MAQHEIGIVIDADDNASGVLDKIGGAVSGLGKVGLAVAGAGIAALGASLVAAVGNAADAQDVFAQTEAVVKSTGGAAGLSAKQMADLASSLSAASGKSKFGDEMILQGENVLATFTSIGKDVFPLATQASIDMAQALHSTPEAMSMMLGKALSSAEGVNALKRSGVSFTEEQQKVIKHLFETGHAADAQRIMLEELNKEFGGSGVAAAQTFSGQLGTLKDKFGELLEGVGTKLLPVLTQFVGFLNSPEVQAGIQALADALVNGVGQAITVLGGLFSAFSTGMQGDGGIIGGLANLLYSLDTISPIFDTIGDAVVNAAVAFGEGGIGGAINSLIYDVTGLQTGLGFLVTDVFAAIGPALEPVMAAFTDAKNPVQGFINAVSMISPVFGAVLTIAQAVLPQIAALVSAVLSTVVAYFQQHGAAMIAQFQLTWATIQATVQQLSAAIAAVIQAFLAQVMIFWQAHGTEIMEFVGYVWAQINSIVQIAMQIIQATIVPMLQWLAGFIRSHSAEIQLVFTVMWTAIKAIITAALAIVKGILSAFLAAVKGDWSGAWAAIKAMADIVWAQIKTLFIVNLAIIKALWETVWNGIKAFFQGIMDSVVGWVIQTFEGIKNSIVSSAGKLRSAAGGVADAIVDGIASGIANGASAIIDAAKDAAMSALNAAKHALGISSPSKLFRAEIGQNIGAGMALGITDMVPQVTGGAAKLAAAATAGASSTVSNTYNLNYQGAPADVGDVRSALRAQALLTGAMQAA